MKNKKKYSFMYFQYYMGASLNNFKWIMVFISTKAAARIEIFWIENNET